MAIGTFREWLREQELNEAFEQVTLQTRDTGVTHILSLRQQKGKYEIRVVNHRTGGGEDFHVTIEENPKLLGKSYGNTDAVIKFIKNNKDSLIKYIDGEISEKELKSSLKH